jgi:alginate O-acetyltransferase complex protein AlgI
VLFDRVFFLFEFLPGVLAAYYLALQVERVARGRLAWAADLSTWVIVAAGALFLWWSGPAFLALPSIASGAISAGVLILACHVVALFVDVRRGEASLERPLTVALYLLQFPLLVAGPLVRFRDTRAQRGRRAAGMGAFTYGVRRVVTGLVKVVLVAGTLSKPVDRIFGMATATLGADVAWLGAVCVSLQIYFQASGYADVAIGLGRMLGLRYPENFRRPYTAGSVRDFWRHWNITLITWLRDYLYLPIAGRDHPTPRLYVNIVAGFSVVGLWHGARGNVLAWSVYSGMWLALEAVVVGVWLERLPRLLRHVYLLVVVVVGWVILRAGSIAAAAGFVGAMGGIHGLSANGSGEFLTIGGWLALGTAVLFAGPLVPWISRWRVSVDAATASILMVTAMALFAWRGATVVLDAVRNRNADLRLLLVVAVLAGMRFALA